MRRKLQEITLFATGHIESMLTTLASSVLAAEQRGFFERIWYAQGHMHPILVHFPIALLMAAAVAAALRPFTARVTSHLVYFCLLLGVGGAILSCFAGWAWAPQEKVGYDQPFNSQSPIFWHRWGGIGVTLAALGVLIWASLSLRKHGAKQWPWELAVVVVAMITGWVGHEGGELVYPDNAAKILGIATGERSVELHESKSVVAPTSGSLFAMKVWPVFQAKCIDCHGEGNNKGGLRMHTEEASLKGGEGMQPLYIKGNSSDSIILKHINPNREGIDDAEFPIMPPKKEKRPVTVEEYNSIKKWIEEGAAWDKPGQSSAVPVSTPVRSSGDSPQTKPAGNPATTIPATMPTTPAATTAPAIPGSSSDSLFAAKIQPLFQTKCVYCHGADKDKGGLKMDTEELALKGGESKQPLWVKGKSSDSIILKHVNPDRKGIDEDEFAIMPPKKEKKPVTAEEFEALKKWIDEGAKWGK